MKKNTETDILLTIIRCEGSCNAVDDCRDCPLSDHDLCVKRTNAFTLERAKKKLCEINPSLLFDIVL